MSIIKNYIYNTIFQVFSVLFPLLTSPILTRTLHSEALGIYSYTTSMAQLFSSFGLLGLNLYSTREIAYVRENERQCSQCFFELFFLRLLLSGVSLIIFLIVFYNSEYREIIFYQAFTFAVNAIDISWLYCGKEKFKELTIRGFFVKVIGLVLILLCVRTPDDLNFYIVIMLGSSFLGNILLLKNIRKLIKIFPIMEMNLYRHVIPCIKLFLPQLASQIYLYTDKIMIEQFCQNIKELAYYDQAERIVKLPVCLVTSLSTVLMPYISSTIRQYNKKIADEYTAHAITYSVILTVPIVFGMVALAPQFIPWFLGREFSSCVLLMQLMSPILLFISLSSVTGNQYMISFNMTRQLTISYSGAAIVNIILNLIFIPKIGGAGAAIGTVFAEFTVLCIQLYFLRESVNIKYHLRSSIRYVIAGSIMYWIVHYIADLFEGVSGIIVAVMAGMLVYGIGLWKIGDQNIKSIILWIIEKRKKI